MLFLGCQPVIVEGTSDQIYLSAIKIYLIGQGLISPKREMLFVPAGGVRGISAVVSILASKEDVLPYVILDSDRSGCDLRNKLKSNLYQDSPDRIIMVGDICGVAVAEIEDLFPACFMADIITQYFPRVEEDFSDVVMEGKPIIPQVEAYAEKYGLILEPGWKVEIAKRAKTRLFKGNDPIQNEQDTIERWKSLFSTIIL